MQGNLCDFTEAGENSGNGGHFVVWSFLALKRTKVEEFQSSFNDIFSSLETCVKLSPLILLLFTMVNITRLSFQ